MKQLTLVLALVAMLPGSVQAQIDVILAGSRPVLRADVAGLTISARMGSRGIDVSVGEARRTVSTSRRSGSGTRPASTSRPSGGTRTTSGRGTGARRASAASVLATADAYVGTKYVWGGETPRGFDCSGFVQYVFRQHGIGLPRTSRQQALVGQAVPRGLATLEAGDLMFFASNGVRIDHIAIYAGENEIIHSSSSGGGVSYDRFSTKRGRWFVSHHVATRRVLVDGRSVVDPLSAALRAFVGFDPPDRAPRR